MNISYAGQIARELNLDLHSVENTLHLLEKGNTIPFIARYRKELTLGMDEVDIAAVRDRALKLAELDKRRQTVIETIEKQGHLTAELRDKLFHATSLAEVEDLYLPFKPKRKTRASVARERGLEPLAKLIMAQKSHDVYQLAQRYINTDFQIHSMEDAISGARDIIAEWVNENAAARKRLRSYYFKEGKISSEVAKNKTAEASKYRDYFKWEEPVATIPSHRILALMRGENEKMLRLSLSTDPERSIDILNRYFVRERNEAAKHVELAIDDSYHRLLHPSMETEVRKWLKEKADMEAIRIFADNLRQLLLAPPLGQKRVLAIDPGFRTGCKIVCLDEQGNLLHNETIYPHPPVSEVGQAIKKLINLINTYKIDAIAVGNGTASRETESFIKRMRFDRDLTVVVVNESGASVYSASKIARQEFPGYDVTVRGAVSIGRRLIDPLAELVKIDPKAIGVGQYQHDVDQTALQYSLAEVVASCVNHVGVELNTASQELLKYVSGIGEALAEKIVKHRTTTGAFQNRTQLLNIPRFGEKAFEQAAGFLRISDSSNPLDKSAVHPESYHIVDKMAADLKVNITDLIGNKKLIGKINPENYSTDSIGLPTITDILKELEKPGRDPRQQFEFFTFDPNVHEISDLKCGMILPGIVTNITAFGAFVDVGVHQDGLVHISNLADRYINDPALIVKIHQKVKVKVLEVDADRRRIQLSMKGVDQ